jgi:hypothetical protein
VDEALIARIVARVLSLLDTQPAPAPGRHILALFSGASSGQQAGLEAIQVLAKDGHEITAVVSFSAGNMLAQERLHSAGISRLIGPGTWVNAPGMVYESDVVMIPTLSMNLAGRLALGLFDDLLATLIQGSLLAGKPVVAVRDGADPDGAGGQVFGAGHAAATLRARLSGNLKTLTSYGMELVPQEEFLAAVQRHVGRQAPAPNHSMQPKSAPAVITQADLQNLECNGVVHVPLGSRLTPLAHDAIASSGLQIVYD